jgi:hypothetical protein
VNANLNDADGINESSCSIGPVVDRPPDR